MEVLRNTRSVCPVCLRRLPAALIGSGGQVIMEKSCPDHGLFRTTVWRGLSDFEKWRGNIPPLSEDEGLSCPENCGICGQHGRGSCCVLLEVTRRCNLRCSFCFANGEQPEPSLEELCKVVDIITEKSKPLIQLSGGEPSLRDDLPKLIKYIRSRGVKYVQLNSNGLRLAEDEAYVKALAEAGLSFVFLQFDGADDSVYRVLRGRDLFEAKRKAIEVCGKYGLGVTLVPTLVRGVNDDRVGEIIRFASSLSPVVRGVHFQPVSYFGRYPSKPDDDQRYTLDELIAALGEQAGIYEENIMPSRCDHPACGLHASFFVADDGGLVPLTRRRAAACTDTTAERNREYIGSRWTRDAEAESGCSAADMTDMDAFIKRVKSHGFTVTAMAFQDAMNFDVERLRRCSLHVYSEGGLLKPFCAAYLTGIGGE